MNVVDTAISLTTNDLWVSMIENWGEANKVYNLCKAALLEECFLKMSKYMWRMLNAMRLIRERLPPKARTGLVHFEEVDNPEFVVKMWLDYKNQGGNTAIPTHKASILQFLRQFQCDSAALGQPLPAACISKMNDKVNDYNVQLAALVTDGTEKQA